jgi:hypothetical protein
VKPFGGVTVWSDGSGAMTAAMRMARVTSI